jgi:diguanylate cyclase (GGDEF)-like protein/PAS domain S-box-containing protein
MNRSRVLLVEDVVTDAELAVRELKRAGLFCEARRVDTAAEFKDALSNFKPHVIISDFSMPHFDGMEALRIARETSPEVPFIFVSGTLGEDYAVRALRNGATDYVLKTNLIRLPAAIERAMREANERRDREALERQVRESEERFRQLAENTRDVFWVFEADSRRNIYVSPAWREVWGGSLDSNNVHQEWAQSIYPGDQPQVLATFQALLEGVGEYDVEYRITRPDGAFRWIHDRGIPIRDKENRIYRAAGIAEDITERKNQEFRIARLSRIQAVLGEINAAIVRITDRETLFREACRIAVEHGGFRMAWIGVLSEKEDKIDPVASSGHDDGFIAQIASLSLSSNGLAVRAIKAKEPIVSNDLLNDPLLLFKDAIRQRGYGSGAVFPLIVAGQCVGTFSLYSADTNFFDEQEMRLLNGLAGDISFALEYLDRDSKLKYLAYYDALTGLPNVTLFQDRLRQHLNTARRGGRKSAVALVNLDRFRQFNETLGRHQGDALLKLLSDRIAGELPESATLARTISDTFVMNIPDVENEDEVVETLQRCVLDVIARPVKVEKDEIRMSAKAGIALYPHDGTEAETLLQNAEAALKKAKALGDKYLFYASEMNARVADKLNLETRLRAALERNEFLLHYQPKVSVANRGITGLEALIRWNDPQTGLVPPIKFISLLEETGMILEVGTWALRQALLDRKKWSDRGLNVPRIAVNVSALQLQQKRFVDILRDTVGEFRGECGLDLEITESLIMQNIEQNAQKFSAIREMGINIAIDDFGTGYSSLSYLAQLPVHALKIDRSFVHSMGASPESTMIVSMIISLAHSLGLKVIAEGVETTDQLQSLAQMQCDEFQGYLFSRPVPPEQIGTLLSA